MTIYAHIEACPECRLLFNETARSYSSDADEFGIGQCVGRYQLLALIGSGGMGVVYRAYDPELRRDVALKVLRAELSNQPRTCAWLRREAQAMARLSHPNVVAVYDAGVHRDRVFIAMEFVHGVTLRRKLDVERSWRVVMTAYLQAARGLAAAHAAGLVHRDFKPDNVLVGDDGRVRVGDFGLVTMDRPGAAVSALEPPSSADGALETTRGIVCGTPAYMSLEAIRGGQVDMRADQFSFCVAAFHQLFGIFPYSGDTLTARETQILQGRIAKPVGSAVPEALYEVLRRGLSAYPGDRYPSIDALTNAIEDAIEDAIETADGGAGERLAGAAAGRQATAVAAGMTPSVVTQVPCPYPGMRPFTSENVDNFYGRDSEIAELIGRLRAGEREIFVIGPSGSGKSSFVTAGLLPRLARGVAGLGAFVVRELRPGEQPTARLAQVLELPMEPSAWTTGRLAGLLAHRGSTASLLIVIDQLEELFTLASASERARFLDALRTLQAERGCAVVFTLRADFFGALMESDLWRERSGRLSRVEVSPLRGEALREAIAAPAQAAGVTVEADLVERLVADAAAEPGILPLLQETLVQLWDKRSGQAITLADYRALGDGERSGLAVALARRADATLRRFSAVQATIARRILLRLVSFGEGRSDTRRQQPRSRLSAASEVASDFTFVLQAMIDDRLLTVDDESDGEPRVDLAHEVMISAWPALAGWIRSHRVDEQRRRQLEAAAARWLQHGRGVRGLLDPIELVEAEQWQGTESAVQLGPSAAVVALIAASRAAQTRQRRRRRVRVSAAAVLGVVVIAVTAAAVTERDQASYADRLASYAHEQTLRAEASDRKNRELVAKSYAEAGRQLLMDQHFQEAITYLWAARQLGEDSAALRRMFWQAERYLPAVPALVHRGEVYTAVFSRDGTRVVTASNDKAARVWSAATGAPVTRPLEHQARVWSAAFSPDGSRVVTASADRTARIWDAATGAPLVHLEHQAGVVSAMFSPDGARVVTASEDKTARVWDATTGKALTRPLEHQGYVLSAAFSPDGARVVTASRDKTARVWDAATGRPITGPLVHRGIVRGATFSPDGTRVVTASDDQTARVWDAMTGKLLVRFEHRADVNTAVFSADGTRVVTASWDQTARVWDAMTGKPLVKLEHQGEVRSAVFSPDGTRVVTASTDQTARVWDAATGKPVTGPLGHQRTVQSAVFSPDGTRVVTASMDQTARVWDAANHLTDPLVHRGIVRSAVFSPDGARVVTASADDSARVWNAATGSPVTGPLEHRGQVWSAAFSPDGTRVVTASLDQTARVWDATTGRPLTPPLEHRAEVATAVFSPDGTRIVTASNDRTARVWDAVTGKPLTPPLAHHDVLQCAEFSPDGARVVTASWDKTARVWDAATGEPLSAPLRHQDEVLGASFSPDGTRIVTASADRTARVWDAATGKPITGPLEHHDVVWSAAFSSDGTRIVTASADKTARVWDAATGRPVSALLEHQRTVKTAAFSPDGTRVVTASWDGTAHVWETATGKLITTIEHPQPVGSAVFSPDGTRVVTASNDRTARIWDAATGKPATIPFQHQQPRTTRVRELQPDTDTLEQWATIAERSPFIVDSRGALVRRADPRMRRRSD